MVASSSAPDAKHELHGESLLRIPLLSHAFTDPTVTWVPRPVDDDWKNRFQLGRFHSGWNPATSELYYPAKGYLATWLPHKESSARRFNYSDRLVKTALFGAHDYLHAWSYHWIKSLLPELGFGETAITRTNIEDFVFLHLLTEAVATVGLDYWYLSCNAVNDVCSIGTRISALTIGYSALDDEEYRRFNPKHNVQVASFFDDMVRFYCTGDFEGVDKNDVGQSPKLLQWLSHELRYGETQREYTRQWLAYLSAEDIVFDREQLKAPVSLEGDWKGRVVGQIRELLWAKVKNHELNVPPDCIDPAKAWRQSKTIDARFTNLKALSETERAGYTAGPEDMPAFIAQLLSEYEFCELSDELVEILPDAVKRSDIGLLRYLLRDARKVESPTCGARDLFFLA